MKYLFEFKDYLNDNFWKWFNGSKVVDDKGNPLIVYHGTNSNFSEFKQSKSFGTHGETDQIEGIYFTDNKDGANWFAFIEDDPKFLKSVYLSMKNPFYSDNYHQLKTELNIDKLKDVRTELIKRGYDGLIVKNGFYSGGGPFKLYLVFEPTQIKSATNNNGTFDLNNPNINENINNKLKNLPPDAIDLIDIISMNPTKSEYQKYKDILKNKFNIDYDLGYGSNDEELIKNASLKDIKDKNDFLNYDNYKKYCKIILRLRGFKMVDVFYEDEISNKILSEDDIIKLSKIIDFNIIKKKFNGNDVAWIEGVDTIAYTEYADVYYVLHEIGHIIDHKLYANKVDLKYSNKSTYSLTSYGTTAGGEAFAENFAMFIINPDKLNEILPDVYIELKKVVNHIWINEIKKIIYSNEIYTEV